MEKKLDWWELPVKTKAYKSLDKDWFDPSSKSTDKAIRASKWLKKKAKKKRG